MSILDNIILFTPKAEVDAVDNLNGFISMCRDQLTVFGADLRFDDDIWDITKSLGLRAKGNQRERLVFSSHATVNNASPTMMSEEFRRFAKSYMRYMHGMRPTKSVGSRLAALRALEAALAENGDIPNVVQLDSHRFNRAAQIVKEHFSAAVAFRVGGQLQMISDFITTNRLSTVPIRWRNFLKRPSDTVGVGEEFDKRRQEKMPSRAVLEALPKAFRLAVETADVIVTSITAILLSAPDRINEVLLLPADCEVNQKQGGGKPDVYGLRWWPAKGAEPMIKLIVSTMADVVREAISRIKLCTNDARDVAAWYEKQPEKIYLPLHLEYLRSNDFLTLEEVGTILWTSDAGSRVSALAWCKENSVKTERQDKSKRHFVSFPEFELALLAMLPENFPYLNKAIGLKYSDAAFIIRKNELHAAKATYRCMIEGMTVDMCNNRLGTGSKNGRQSVFERLGIVADDGQHIEVTTHQFRHYLNTIAQAGQMSDVDIAKWSGRKDISQNAAYDHTTVDQRVEQLREALGDDSRIVGPLSEIPKYIPIRRDEFARLVIPTAHTTDFGICIHDYTMTPCQLHLDCINCQEQVCVKGDAEKMDRARQRLAEGQVLLDKAEEAMKNGYFGADRWFEHHRTTVEHLTQLCQLFDDPKINDGAYIQLSIPKMASRLQLAVDDRAALENEPSNAVSDADLDLLRDLMNGL
jgi:hypothetical protein